MVESILPGGGVAVPATRNVLTIKPPKELLYPDGSAVPDVIAKYHRPEDLDDMSDQSVPDETDSEFFGKDGLTFGDLLDIINPLQHIPIVSTIYRALTGDEISPGARIAGGALFGGPVGLGIAVVNAAVETSTGEDIGETIMTALTGDATTKAVQTATAPQPAETAVAVSETNPAILGIGTTPVSLLPTAAGTAQRVTAPAPKQSPIASSVPFAGTGLPFGGMGALPFTAVSKNANDPVAAVLQARSAVPQGGPIPGFGSAPLGRVDRQSPLPVIGSRLSDKLAALAAKTAAQSVPTRQRDDDKSDDRNKSVEQNAAPSTPLQFTPTTTISQTMLNALDRYQRMKETGISNVPSG